VRERTGRDRAEWFAPRDAWGAAGRSHREIARWLAGEHRVDSWSSQSTTVAYEQARGPRAPGQQADVDAESAAEMKALWRVRLTALKDLLET
jgi:hypothetical protein